MKGLAHLLAGCLLGLVLLWSPGGADAQQNDTGAIHAAVQSQLQAFARDDAAAAFSLASASTRTLMGTPENFLRFIRDLYPPVYRHRQAVFEAPEIFGSQAVQIVNLTDGEDVVWIAVYLLQQEPDGSWKVDGCTLHETDSIAI